MPLALWVLPLSVASNLLALVLPLALLQVYDRILPSAEYGTALSLFAAVAVAILLDGVLRMARSRALARDAILAEHRATVSLARDILAADLARLRATGYGARRGGFDAVARGRDVGGASARLPLYDLPFAVVFLLLVWVIGGALAAIPLGVLLLCSLLSFGVARRQREAAVGRAAAEQDLRTRLADAFAGMLDLKGLGHAGRLLNRLDAAMVEQARQTELSERRESLLADGLQVASVGATVAVTLLGALAVVEGQLTTGALAACSILGGRAVSAGLGAFTALARHGAAEASAREVEALRSTLAPDAACPPAGAPAGAASGNLILGDVVVRGAAGPLGPVSATLQAGDVNLVTGGDDAARLDLLLTAGGFSPAEGGVVSPPGPAVLVPEHPTLFNGTLLDNMTGWDPSRIEAARRLSERLGLAPLVDRQPDGVRTEVTRTMLPALSAGVTKRVSLVRALVSSAPLLLLHHPEAGLDVEGRRRLAEVLGSGEWTVLLATDDPALAALAVQVIHLPEAEFVA